MTKMLVFNKNFRKIKKTWDTSTATAIRFYYFT